ncbi:uncharacterized protein LOC112099865 [Citrus clementina]|uniref:uncharacterized protein LOC112099865 n=1 Tax=Citrus clementina TaxID=85681 RepID=UPI000CED0920|nr:uncharacterized protein LOC112099865 [Citrus x clementina]
MDSTHYQTLLCMKLSLDWTEMLKAFIFGTFNPAVGIGAVLVYIIFTDPNNSLSTGDKDEDWEKLYVYPPDAVDCKAEDRRIHYLPHYLVWESVAILVINYFHLAVEHIVYKISRGAPEFMFADSVFFAIIFGSLQFMLLHCLTMITDADSLSLIRKRILNHQLI